MGKILRILLVEDHFLARQGLKNVLTEHFKNVDFGEADKAQTALEKSWNEQWDVVLLSASLPGRGGLAMLKEMHQGNPKLPIIVISPCQEEDQAVRALQLGALSHLGKECGEEDYVKAVEAALCGAKYITAAVAQQLANHVSRGNGSPHQELSDREYQVTCLLAVGKTAKEISGELSLSVKTVSTYRSRIMEKLGLQNNSQLMRYAIQHSLVRIPLEE